MGGSKGTFCYAMDQMGNVGSAKVIGGWGMINIHRFSKALAAKVDGDQLPKKFSGLKWSPKNTSAWTMWRSGSGGP
jgi:hypothetical protein